MTNGAHHPAPTRPTRVLIADDHPMVADGIRAILETHDQLQVVGTLGDGQAVVDRFEALNPDVILLDLNMPNLNGLTATELILERRPDMRVIILSMHDEPEYVSTALNHGARGYILKDVPTGEIVDAIDKVMSGARYLCSAAQDALSDQGQERADALTSREQTVLLKLAQGKSNKQVAVELDISVRTVETHRKNIKTKLGISSTAGLTRYAMQHGVLQGTDVEF